MTERWQCFENALRRTLKFTSVIHISASKLDIYNVTYKKSIVDLRIDTR